MSQDTNPLKTKKFSVKMPEVTSNDLLDFMTSFWESIEEKITSTNVNLEEKIEKMDEKMSEMKIKLEEKVDKVDGEVNRLNTKMSENLGAMERMDKRMTELEQEMRKSDGLRRETDKWRLLAKIDNQPSGRNDHVDQSKDQSRPVKTAESDEQEPSVLIVETS